MAHDGANSYVLVYHENHGLFLSYLFGVASHLLSLCQLFELMFGSELLIIGVVIPQIHSHSILRYHSSLQYYLPTQFFFVKGLPHFFPIFCWKSFPPKKHTATEGSIERRFTVRMLADLAFGLLAKGFSIPKFGSTRIFFWGMVPRFCQFVCENKGRKS